MDIQSVGVHPLCLGSFFHYLLKAMYKLAVLEMRLHICAKIGTHTHIHIWDSGADGGAEGRVQDQL
uniref:Uncharacterized protein n=1 Tax=Oryzias sinensis TaxID=183150 RepID=A0A8C7XS74_9TELE